MENRNTMPTNPAPYVLEGYTNILVDGYDRTIQQHRVVDSHKLFKEGYRLWQLYPELPHVDRDHQLVIGYSIANKLEISKRSVLDKLEYAQKFCAIIVASHTTLHSSTPNNINNHMEPFALSGYWKLKPRKASVISFI